MKILKLLGFLFLFSLGELTAQEIDKPEEVSASLTEFYKVSNADLNYSFDEDKQIHNYSGNWDFDGDKKPDSIWFVGNDAAHIYFYLKMKLSSKKTVQFFDYISDDMPILQTVNVLQEQSKEKIVLPMFVVHDFNKDGVVDLYISNNGFLEIPKTLQLKGVTSQRIVLSFRAGKFSVHDLKHFKSFE